MRNFILIFCILGMGEIVFAQTNTFPSSGNVGIGTTSPVAPLEVYKSQDSYIKVRNSGGNYSYLNLTGGTSSAYLIKNNIGSAINGASAGALYTFVEEGYDFQHIENTHARLTIKSGGNVGIGTSSPATKLHVMGSNNMFTLENDNTASNQYTQMHLKAGTASNYIWTNNQNSSGFYGGSSALNIYTGQNSPIAFFTNGNNERMRIEGNGNVGIGTASPAGFLDVSGANAGGNVSIYFRNQTGINTIGSGTTLNFPVYNGTTGLQIAAMTSSKGGFNVGAYDAMFSTGQSTSYLHFSGGSSRIPQVTINNIGNMGIGTTSPSEKLSVNGKIRAKEVKVEITDWPDYVFEADYRLPDLKETEQFIKEHKHLPEIPSSGEVEKGGINLGEMNAKLLQKIEELTLHLIDMNKKLEEQDRKYREQQKEILQLKLRQ